MINTLYFEYVKSITPLLEVLKYWQVPLLPTGW